MHQILVYGDSQTWGIVPGSRERWPFSSRWPIVMEAELTRSGHAVRVIDDSLNGRRTVWEDPFKPGRNGLAGLEQRIEINSPLALVILMLGTNDFQSVHQYNVWHSAQGLASLVRAIRRAPIEPGMPVPPVLIVAPPPSHTPSGLMTEKFDGARTKSAGLAAAYQDVARELDCWFFDAATVTTSSQVDGIHLDLDQHLRLGRALANQVAPLLESASEPEPAVTRGTAVVDRP
jgi:lysophospholipase L1-like esterase